MEKDSQRWTEVNPSRYPWEREGLAFIRSALPDSEPYRAWANVEFVGDDGTINEIDLFVVTRTGAYLIELKSHPGIISGDNTQWRWVRPDGSRGTLDNPLPVTRRKCHRLESMLQRQPALRALKGRPHLQIEPIVFLTDKDLDCQLNPAGRANVFGRGTAPKRPNAPLLPSVVDLLRDSLPAGVSRRGPKHAIDGPMSRAIADAVTQANIRPSTASRRIGEYDLVERMGDGEGWEDWSAIHRASGVSRRIRRWLREDAFSTGETERLNRAAKREFELLKILQHDSILLPLDLREHELGPALVFATSEDEQRLDLWIAEHQDRLDASSRVRMVRDVAEALAHAHRKLVFHRALSPQSIRVSTNDDGPPRLRIADWQSAARFTGTQASMAGTSHLAELVTDAARAYLAPEALGSDEPEPEKADVFALGAIAYLIVSGAAPAANPVELRSRIREDSGLDLARIVDAPVETLRDLIIEATHPSVDERMATVADFLAGLDLVSESQSAAVAAPDGPEIVDDPLRAEAGDILPGSWRVERRLGKGSTAVALLVNRDGRREVWKVALDPSHDERLRSEFDVLESVKHKGIVKAIDIDDVGPRTVLHLEQAGEETLAQHLRQNGRLSLDFLERWGDDLIEVLAFLEEDGVAHRDIKPDNLGVKPRRPSDEKHLVLFDFSLARVPAENLRAGTTGYLDPFLEERPNRRWDWQAERWSVAITLYEMATGARPRWPGGSDPAAVPGMELVIERELFDTAVADGLAAFFTRALRRDPAERYSTVEEMLRAWKRALAGAGTGGLSGTTVDDDDVRAAVERSTAETPLVELGLTPRALDALGRVTVHTAGDLTNANLVSLQRLRGVGDKTRREIARVARLLQDRLGGAAGSGDDADLDTVAAFSVDRLYDRLIGKTVPKTDQVLLRMFLEPHLPTQLAADGESSPLPTWPVTADVSRASGLGNGEVSAVLGRATDRWKRTASLAQLRNELHQALVANGGVMAADELVAHVLTVRGSASSTDTRIQRGRAVVRAVIECDAALSNPQWERVSDGERLIIADDTSDALEGRIVADYAFELGAVADELAEEVTLPATATVVNRLQMVEAPAGFEPLTDARLIRLAAASSRRAATSSRLDLYPRGMPVDRAISLARPVLLGSGVLSVEAVQKRVRGRFPEATPLPGRPQLDLLLEAIGLFWTDAGPTAGYQVRQLLDGSLSMSPTVTRVASSASGSTGFDGDGHQAAEFDRRLDRLRREGGFCAITVRPQRVEVLEHRLVERLEATIVNIDDVLLAAMRAVATELEVDWQVVLGADSDRNGSDWANLQRLVEQAMPLVRQRVRTVAPTVVLTSAGLLGRYKQMAMIGELRDHTEGLRRIEGATVRTVLVIVASDQPDARPMLADQPVPIIDSSQWTVVPRSWLADRTPTHAGDPQ